MGEWQKVRSALVNDAAIYLSSEKQRVTNLYKLRIYENMKNETFVWAESETVRQDKIFIPLI